MHANYYVYVMVISGVRLSGCARVYIVNFNTSFSLVFGKTSLLSYVSGE